MPIKKKNPTMGFFFHVKDRKGWDFVKNGKITDNVFDRSVHKILGKCRQEADGITIVPALVSGMMTADGRHHVPGMYAHAVIKAANHVAALGKSIQGISLHIVLSEKEPEQSLRIIMQEIKAACETQGMNVLKTYTQISPAVDIPLVTVTGYGESDVKEGRREQESHDAGESKNVSKGLDVTGTVRANQSIVMTKWTAIEGTIRLAKERQEQILEHLPKSFLQYAEEMESLLSIVPECKIALKNGAKTLYPVSEGGIFGALWELGRQTRMGMEVDLMQIPIRQETVEICEIFDINPYQLAGSGALLVVTKNGPEMCRILEEEGICATVIGEMTHNNDRIIRHGEERRYMESSTEDEIFGRYILKKKG